MKDILQSQADRYTKEHKKKKRWYKVVTALAAVAVFCTTYALILPAITWERSLVCEIPEHRHGDSCYEMVTVPGEKELVCLETEHVHGPDCYIVTDNLICGLEECEGHTHGEGCLNEAGEIVCGLEVSEGHSHSEACYEKELVCQTPEHTHSDSCWVESEPREEMVLVCQLEEHEHTAACFDAPPAEDDGYYCGKIEHTHSDGQYCGSLQCTIPEHVHTLACKSNPKADVETDATWNKTFANVELTGNWSDDVIAIAKTQIGYSESARNYEVMEDGTTMKGYTRYGDWYGNSYGDWCAMFCSFCLHYAGVDREMMPFEAGCEKWIRALTEEELYHEEISEYEPKPGDLVFFDYDDDDTDADHVGFVFEVHEDGLTTIEGNWGDCVCTVDRKFADGEIIGYGELPENPTLTSDTLQKEIIKEVRTIESIPAEDGAIAVISGNLPEGAEAVIKTKTASLAELITYLGTEKASLVTNFTVYDIKIMVNGEEWEPDETVNVIVRQSQIYPNEYTCFSSVHIDELTGDAVELNVNINDEGEICFETEGFSDFVFALSVQIPECDCGNSSLEIKDHSYNCSRQTFFRELAEAASADEIYSLWSRFSDDEQEYIITYLTWNAWQYQEKLDRLNELIAGAGSISCEEVNLTGLPEGATVSSRKYDDFEVYELSNLIGLPAADTYVYSISAVNSDNSAIKYLGGSTVQITVSDIPEADLISVYHLLDSKEAIQAAASNGTLKLKRVSGSSSLLQTEMQACEEFLQENGSYLFWEDTFSPGQNAIAYTESRSDEGGIDWSNGTVSFSTDSLSTFIFSTDNVITNWRTARQPLTDCSQLGDVDVVKNSTIPAEYHFSMGTYPFGKNGMQVPGNAVYRGNKGSGVRIAGWSAQYLDNCTMNNSYAFSLSPYTPGSSIPSGEVSALYTNVGTYNGQMVDVRVSVVGYTSYGNYFDSNGGSPTAPVIAFPETCLGVGVCGVDTVTLAYDFFIAGTNTPIVVKGFTTYSDIDIYQGILLHDNCDSILISTSGDYSLYSTVQAQTVDGAPFVFDYNESSTNHQSSYSGAASNHAGFTELFRGASITRTFTFKHTANQCGNGHIFNEAFTVVPKDVGMLVHKSVVNGSADDEFTFTIEIKNNGNPVSAATYGDVQIGSNGKGSFTLKDDESVVIRGLYAGWVVTITEADNGYETTVNGVSGKTYTHTVTSGEANQIVQVGYVNEATQIGVRLVKTDSTGNQALEGAKFALYGADDNGDILSEPIPEYSSMVSGADGCFSPDDFKLPVGVFYLVETEAPLGYQKMSDALKMEVKADKIIVYGDGLNTSSITVLPNADNVCTVSIKNTSAYVLPATGGIGVYPIYALGVLLIAGSIVYGCILRRKRERRAE